MKKEVIIGFFLIIFLSGCSSNPFQVSFAPKFDFGDAPDPKFPSLLASNGARHNDITKAWFGKAVDNETDSKQINVDPFDDGLVSISPIIFGVTNKDWDGRLYVNILIDFNQDGDWENATSNGPDPGEWAVKNMQVVVPKNSMKTFVANVSLPEEIWMRMTLTDVPLSNYFGEGEFKMGETEDYYI